MAENETAHPALTDQEREVLADAAHCAPNKQIMAALAPEVERLMRVRMIDAWDRGYLAADLHYETHHNGGEIPADVLATNPYRLHDLYDVAPEFGVELEPRSVGGVAL